MIRKMDEISRTFAAGGRYIQAFLVFVARTALRLALALSYLRKGTEEPGGDQAAPVQGGQEEA